MTIDEILEAHKNATPGLWFRDGKCIGSKNGYISHGFYALGGNGYKAAKAVGDYNLDLACGAPQLAAEVRRLREREKELTEAPWYLLFDGTSDDGRGEGQYIGRTTDKNVAMKHYSKCKSNPYSTGKVVEVTDKSYARLFNILPVKEL